MNDSIKRISLDLHATCSREKVKVKRSDTGRKIYVSLVDGGMPYHISDDCYAIFTGKKPDGNILFNDCTIEGNVIIYKLTEQTAAVPGLVNCEIKLYGADARLITSPKFSIMVDDTVYDEGDEIESTDEFSALTALVAEVQEMKAEKGNYYAPAVSQADENTMVVSFTPSSKALPEIEDMAITLPEGPHGEPGEDGTTIHWVAASCAGSQKTIAISAFFATPKDGDYAFTNDYWLCTVSNVTATTAKIIPVGNIIGPQGDPGPAGEDGQMFHLINESGKTVDNPVAMLGSYMTEPKVDDFVLTNTFNLYVVTGVDLVNQRVEVNLLGNLKGDSYVLTEQDKEEIANLVSVKMGDIDSALDSIIEIQDSLIGGDGA